MTKADKRNSARCSILEQLGGNRRDKPAELAERRAARAAEQAKARQQRGEISDGRRGQIPD